MKCNIFSRINRKEKFDIYTEGLVIQEKELRHITHSSNQYYNKMINEVFLIVVESTSSKFRTLAKSCIMQIKSHEQTKNKTDPSSNLLDLLLWPQLQKKVTIRHTSKCQQGAMHMFEASYLVAVSTLLLPAVDSTRVQASITSAVSSVKYHDLSSTI